MGYFGLQKGEGRWFLSFIPVAYFSGIFIMADAPYKEKDYIKAKDVEGDTKIVLFHGTVDRCETDLGFRLPSDIKSYKTRNTIIYLLFSIGVILKLIENRII